MTMKWQEFRKIIKEDLRLPEPIDQGFSARAKAGFEVCEPVPAPRFRWARLGTLAGSLLAVFSMGLVVFLGTQVRATVSLDINPSLSLKVNYFHQVIEIEADNAEGVALLETLDSRSGSLSKIIGEILSEAQTREYLPADSEVYLLFGVSGKDYTAEQKVETLVLEAIAEENVQLLFVNKHDAQENLVYSGISSDSPSVWEEVFGSWTRESALTVTTSTSIPFEIFDPEQTDIGSDFLPGTSSEWYSISKTPFLDNLSEAEFLALAETYEVSATKLQLAVLVFRGYGNYLAESDLKNLCHLSVEDLIKLYSALG
jgi:hypothetical protein